MRHNPAAGAVVIMAHAPSKCTARLLWPGRSDEDFILRRSDYGSAAWVAASGRSPALHWAKMEVRKGSIPAV